MIRRLTIATAALLLCVCAQGTPERELVPRDVAYPGTIILRVDATDIERRIFRVRESIPVQAGTLTLLYPQWIPGNHAPRGPIEMLAGLNITAGGKRVEWTRDPQNVYAFHLEVPMGVNQLEVEFQLASPVLSMYSNDAVPK